MGVAVALHILAFVLSLTLPMLLSHRPLLDNVVTVNLVSMPDTGQEAMQTEAPQAEQAPPPEPEPAPEPEPVPRVEPVKPKVQVTEPPPVVKETPVAKQVSLKPLKKKVKRADDEKIAQEKAEEQRLKEIAQARLAEQNAQREAERARAALAEMIKARGAQKSATSSTGRPSARQGVSNIVSQQYLMEVGARMQQFWVLPEMRQWDPRLETVVVLTIGRDGAVVKTEVEQKSADPFFDQFVMQTIEKASPMPPFPKLMREDAIEVGFRFRPNEKVSW